MTPEQKAELENMQRLLLGKIESQPELDLERESFKGTPEQFDRNQRLKAAVRKFRSGQPQTEGESREGVEPNE